MANPEEGKNKQSESQWRVVIEGTSPSPRTIEVSEKVRQILADPKKGPFEKESSINPQNKVLLAVWNHFAKTVAQLEEAQGDGFYETTNLFQDMSRRDTKRLRAQLSRRGVTKEMVFNMISGRIKGDFGYSEIKASDIAERFWQALYEEKNPR